MVNNQLDQIIAEKQRSGETTEQVLVDLIPDFIPLLGWIDELVILPALLSLAVRLMPEDVWQECQHLAQSKPTLPASQRAGWVIRAVWIVVVVTLVVWIVTA